MSLFDAYLARIREYTSILASRGTEAHIWSEWVLAHSAEPDHPRLILKEDSAIELGGPRSTGTSFVMWTEDPGLVSDGRIALLGSDIPQLCGLGFTYVPFGQVLLVAGASLGGHSQLALERQSHLTASLPGYSVRGTGNRIWSRVSREACVAGFSFRLLGTHILRRTRQKVEGVSAAEIIFVTSSYEDVIDLEKIGVQVRKISHDLRRQRLKEVAVGVYECETAISCDACPDNVVCTEIRQILVIRKKGSEQEQTRA